MTALRYALFPALLAFALPVISSAADPETPADEATSDDEAATTGEATSAAQPAATTTPAAPASVGHRAMDDIPREVVVSTVTLSDGQTLRGQIVTEAQDSVTLQLLSGGRMELPRATIRSIRQNDKVNVTSAGEVWFHDPNRTRYFYAPSAMMLKAGEGYFSQKELFFSAIAYGITDNVSILVGSALPLWFYSTSYSSSTFSGMNLIGALKGGVSLAENFHVAAGAESLTLPMLGGGGMAFGFLFGSATLGNSNAHLTVSGGKPFSLGWGSTGSTSLGEALFVVAGELRVGSNFALMTENWIMPFFSRPDLFTLDAVGGRIFGEQWAVDLGLIFAPRASGGIPIPWVDFTYNFNVGRK